MLNRTFRLLLLVACLVTGTLWAANDSFVGGWKLNPSRSKLTDVMKVESLGANKYIFNFGAGPETIVVDGTDQPGHYGTTLSVAIEGDTWKVIRKRDGRMQVSAIWSLSEDGSTLTDHFTGFNANGSTYNLNYVYKRKARGSGFAGEWVSTSETVNSVVMLQVRPYEGDGLSFIEPAADVTRNVKFDGKDYPNLGPNATPGSTSSIRRVNEHVLEMTYKINGKVLYTQKIELSSDLKTLTVTRLIVGESEPNIRVFERQ
ncbi:MAG: hypothetical protein WB762_15835 [Candidatus Sulfotelmatobacter sp.]